MQTIPNPRLPGKVSGSLKPMVGPMCRGMVIIYNRQSLWKKANLLYQMFNSLIYLQFLRTLKSLQSSALDHLFPLVYLWLRAKFEGQYPIFNTQWSESICVSGSWETIYPTNQRKTWSLLFITSFCWTWAPAATRVSLSLVRSLFARLHTMANSKPLDCSQLRHLGQLDGGTFADTQEGIHL